MTQKKVRAPKVSSTVGSNQLSLLDIDQMHSEYEQQKEVKFQYGEKVFTIQVDKKFQITKLDNLISEFSKKVLELQDNNIELSIDAMRDFTKNIGHVLILKYFTNMPIEDSLTSTQLLDVFKKILNIRDDKGISLFNIVWHQFDPNEIEWFNEQARKITANFINQGDKLNEEFKEMELLIERVKQNIGDGQSA